jgi:hypothetical protein
MGNFDKSSLFLLFLPKNRRAALSTIIQNSRKRRTITARMSSPKITLAIIPPSGNFCKEWMRRIGSNLIEVPHENQYLIGHADKTIF